jgi:hypothetical protein
MDLQRQTLGNDGWLVAGWSLCVIFSPLLPWNGMPSP